MKNKSNSRPRFIYRRFSFAVNTLSVVTAASLFAGEMERNLSGGHVRRPDGQLHRSGLPAGYIAGVQRSVGCELHWSL